MATTGRNEIVPKCELREHLETFMSGAKNKSSVLVRVLFGVSLVAAIGFHGYRLWSERSTAPSAAMPEPPAATIAVPSGLVAEPLAGGAFAVSSSSGALDAAALEQLRQSAKEKGLELHVMGETAAFLMPVKASTVTATTTTPRPQALPPG